MWSNFFGEIIDIFNFFIIFTRILDLFRNVLAVTKISSLLATWIVLGLACCEIEVSAQDRNFAVEKALSEQGFCNIRVAQSDSLTVVTVQNEAYKLQASGISAAVQTLEKEGLLEGGVVKLIVLDYGVPQVTLTYDYKVGWKVSHHLDRSDWKLVRTSKKVNSSFGKIDIVVYPQVSLMNLIITQVYQSLWQLSPAVEFGLWPGAKFSYQVKIPVWNDGYGSLESKIHPGMITFSQRFRLPLDITGKVVAGVFANSRYGVGIEMQKRFSFAPWIMVEGGFRMLGLNYYDGFTLYMSNELKPFWHVSGNMYWPRVNTEFRLTVEKYLLEDVGAKAEMIRHFAHCSIGFYLEKGFNTYAHTNGGFRVQIALPPYRYRRRGYWPRVNTSAQMGMSYNANNEQMWYRETRLEASDNIMSRNAFNPYYIESEINRLNK